MKKYFVIDSLTKENIDSIKEGYKNDLYTDDLGGGMYEHWINTNGSGMLMCLVEYADCTEECRLILYGVKVDELRTIDFLNQCIENEDVNHCISGDGMPQNIIQVVEFVSGKSNKISVTPCGLENYLY